jgi:hypothetical protein
MQWSLTARYRTRLVSSTWFDPRLDLRRIGVRALIPIAD